MLFTVTDYQNIPVSMSENTWNQKLLDPSIGHPEIKPYFNYIQKAIQDPDIVFQSVRDPRSQLFIKSSVGKRMFKNTCFVVVIKYWVVMFNRSLPKTGSILWTKKDSS